MKFSILEIMCTIMNRNDIVTVAKNNGIHVDKSGMAFCPFHKDEKKTLKINVKDRSFNCPVCKTHGCVIDSCFTFKKF